MKRIILAAAAIALLGGCQTPQQAAELASICADPRNREPDPDSIYYAECAAVVPRSNQQLEQDWFSTAPTGDTMG